MTFEKKLLAVALIGCFGFMILSGYLFYQQNTGSAEYNKVKVSKKMLENKVDSLNTINEELEEKNEGLAHRLGRSNKRVAALEDNYNAIQDEMIGIVNGIKNNDYEMDTLSSYDNHIYFKRYFSDLRSDQ